MRKLFFDIFSFNATIIMEMENILFIATMIIVFIPFLLILVPSLFSFFYGLRIKEKGYKRLLIWIILHYFVSIIDILVIAFLTIGIRNIDSNPSFNIVENIQNSITGASILTILNVPVMYLGLFVQNLRQRHLK